MSNGLRSRWSHVAAQPAVDKPSSLYSASLWRSAVKLAGILPRHATEATAKTLARVYWRLAGHRKSIVIDNLAPVLHGDREKAAVMSMRLISQFALKLVDLWRYEGGADKSPEKTQWEGWPAFESARSKGKGVLIVTPHLGNWEFGASFFAQHGIPLQVLTQAEPQAELTSMRGSARAERGIETIVVGENPFAFIEVIKRLQSGATVALLLDRPLKSSAVMVELFDQPFAATIAAAELARASGCAIVPAYVVRGKDGYSARILPEIPYDRAGIGNRQERIALTERVMKSFEPAIREHLDQWFHFVPLWRNPAYQPNETKP